MRKINRGFVFLLALALVISMCGMGWAMEMKKVNINTATQDELSSALNKIGPAIAQKIIAYREKNGPFKKPEDLKNVKGIGDKVFEINKDRISVGKPMEE